MSKNFSSPQEIAESTISIGVKKADLSILKMLLLGIFAGVFIGFGAYGAIIIMQTLGGIDAGFAKFAGAAVFPVGLMLVVVAGAELFTGNCLMTLSVMDRKTTLMRMLKNWLFVFIGNFIGSVLLALTVAKTGLMGAPGSLNAAGELAVKISVAKVSLGFGEAFLRAILCNILVVLAVWLAIGAQDIVSKLFSCWFPIMLFVLCGFEHSIANMFFIPVGLFMGASVTWGSVWLDNLLPVTLGNIVGGAIIVPVFYYVCYIQRTLPKKSAQSAEDSSNAAS